ncbi:ABC-type nitrate/sulfonate/bicarbonate transport system, periplasmic component [Gottschalkia purinilytica]|uniref:ABC-type nitrate/sulfonate/bicarbonate transport system, periplasmic component n=1 Tax=Gottschalkia purinilytica TaxID=1503 RepID=A0A0L0W9B1_GOTPU|nr:ABC transporter substrate-binding protein [Gottschalkia purinilytica]KNF07905.1 ABC-type nitrate/sulfonate/bicarbonate transport system, periplasmic component [Gottschalkia purinilytica]
MKKVLLSIFLIFTMVFFSACGQKDQQTDKENDIQASKENEVPTISVSWGNELHTGIMHVPLKRVDDFKKKGTYFNPISNEQFELIKDDKKLALFNFIPTKGGSEVASLMSQKHLDAAFTSNTAILSAVDQGTPIKILSPIQTDGVALVFSPDKNFYGWEEVKKHIQGSNVPVKIGYHSPVSGPRIVLESVLKNEGLKVTEDPNNSKADVLLVDLKGSKNLLPSLSSKQVDAWVGPSHYPEAAEVEKLGKIVLNLKDFPPAGKWENFPCCVFAAREDILEKYPEVFEAMTELITENAKYTMEHKDDVSKIMAEIIGVPEEAIKASQIKYTTDPSEQWLSGIKVYVDALSNMGKLTGELKGKNFDEVKDKAFDFTYTNKANNK